MALTSNQLALTKLYLASFARAPETGGLNYWSAQMAGGKSMDDIVKTVFSLPIVKAIYPDAMSNDDFLTAVYRNCFGKLPDTGGLAYWKGQLTGGAERSSLVMTMIDAGLGTPDGTSGKAYITNRFDSAQYAVTQQLAQSTEIGVQRLKDIMATVNAGPMACHATIEQYSGAKISGKLADGYIKGATVFADANGNGKWDPGEATTTTDDSGNFTLTGAKGAIHGTGGIDLSTNKPFAGELQAPEGSSVINPLTSLQQSFVERGQTIEQAAATVAKALGFDSSSIRLESFDPLAAALSSTATAGMKSLGAQLQSEAAKVANLLVTAGNTLVGAAGGEGKFSQVDASKAILDSIVSNMAAKSDGVISMADKTFLQSVLTESVTQAGNAALTDASSKVASMAASFATVAADSAQKVNEIFAAGGDVVKLIAGIAQTQAVTQGDMAAQILSSATSGTLTSVETSFTGTAFDSAVSKATIGNLDPSSTTVSEAVAAINAAATAASTTPPPASGGGGSGGDSGGGSSGGGSSGGGGSPTPDPASLAYEHTTFTEAAANDGSITMTSTITLSNDTFSGANSAALGSVTHVPAGLTAHLVKASATTATLSFTGNATAHANANDISNLTVSFGNGDFTGGSAAAVSHATKADLAIDFADPTRSNQSLDGLGGTFSSPATFDAASGNELFDFIDRVATESFTRITHFGADDSIAITDGHSNHLVVANNGADVVFTVNANGIVSQITLVGVVTDPATIIGSLSAFNALAVGDVTYS